MAILRAGDNSGGTAETLGDGNTHHIRTIQFVQPLGQRLELLLIIFLSALDKIFVFVLEFDALLGDGRKALSVDCGAENE